MLILLCCNSFINLEDNCYQIVNLNMSTWSGRRKQKKNITNLKHQTKNPSEPTLTHLRGHFYICTIEWFLKLFLI